jgi:hypothetical protein
MDLRKHKSKTRPFTATFGEGDDTETVTGNYRPFAFTPRLLQEAEAAQKAGEVSETLAKTFAPLVASWDLTDDGKPVPISADALMDVPVDILAGVTSAIGEAQRPNPKGSED